MTWFTAERLFVLACMVVGVVVLVVATELAARRAHRRHDQAVADLRAIHRHRQTRSSLHRAHTRARRCHPTRRTP
jgi:hypothetical protein